MKRLPLLLLIFMTWKASAQFTYTIDQSIPVEIDGRSLSMPFAGGINSAQVNTMDLNGDDKQDLVIFDRAADKILTFLNVSNKYKYAPQYEELFPSAISQWMLLRDFNCDGRKDIFTSDPFGIIVFVNITTKGQPLKWRSFNPGFPLLTKGFNGNINLKINETDIPAIDDVDNDGDLDILNLRFVGIGTVEWHKNLSVERTGKCDSLQLERVTQTYGSFEECLCGVFAYGGQTCTNLIGGGKTQHVGGKTLLTLDVDGDGDRELLYSEETCSPLFLMNNIGDKSNAILVQATNYPPSRPAIFQIFPGPYLEDVDFDGKQDLIISPNLYARQFTNVQVNNSVWYYKNTSTTNVPSFTFVQTDFLQNEMIEIGDYSTPAFFDFDGDGDEDLFVGAYGDASFRGTITLFENKGTKTEPSYRLVTRDFGGLSGLFAYNFKIQFADMNGDGTTDLAFTSTGLQNGITSLHYFPNSSTERLSTTAGLLETTFRIGQAENLRVTDVNGDGIPDILLGKSTGALQYWENTVNSGFFDALTLKNGSYLGLGNSTSRQNPAVAVGDLDADGRMDLVLADQRGVLSFYADYRNFDPAQNQPTQNIVYNEITQQYVSKNFGARVWPAITNIFNSDKPAIVMGNTLGGLMVLKNDEGMTLPDEPVITISPIPMDRRVGDEVFINADRNMTVQIYSVLGQVLTKSFFITANQSYRLPVSDLAASGLYIARFKVNNKTYVRKFIIQ